MVNSEDCNYFILKVGKDPHAIVAIQAYAKSCKKDSPGLSADLLRMIENYK